MSIRRSAAVAATEFPCPATSASNRRLMRPVAQLEVNIPAALRLSIGFAVDPRVQPSHFNAPGRELAASPDFHALHVLCRLVAHRRIIRGSREEDDPMMRSVKTASSQNSWHTHEHYALSNNSCQIGACSVPKYHSGPMLLIVHELSSGSRSLFVAIVLFDRRDEVHFGVTEHPAGAVDCNKLGKRFRGTSH